MTPVAEAAVADARGDVICAGVVHVYPGEEGPIVALRNVDFEARSGEMLAVLGPSGSGKTTLLSVLTGLLRPTAGKVLLAGHDLARLDDQGLQPPSVHRARAAPPGPPAEPHSVRHPAREPGIRPAWRTPSRVAAAMASRGAGGHVRARSRRAPTRAPALRREQQRVAMASAVATSPCVLLADEPTCQLDAVARDSVIDALRHAHDLSGATIIVVTHDPLWPRPCLGRSRSPTA